MLILTHFSKSSSPFIHPSGVWSILGSLNILGFFFCFSSSHIPISFLFLLDNNTLEQVGTAATSFQLKKLRLPGFNVLSKALGVISCSLSLLTPSLWLCCCLLQEVLGVWFTVVFKQIFGRWWNGYNVAFSEKSQNPGCLEGNSGKNTLSQDIWVPGSALTLNVCVTLGKSQQRPGPHFSLLQNENNNSCPFYTIEFLNQKL